MDLVLFSDTHELHREVEVPLGDVLICCGDFSMFDRDLAMIEDFNEWLGELPHRHKLVIYGNHSFAFEADPGRRSLLYNATVLHNEGVLIDGLRFWGSPATPIVNGAFGIASSAPRTRHWSNIPVDTNVLITHGPPFGRLDRPPGGKEHMGDRELLAASRRLPYLRLHVFGHVHGQYGTTRVGRTVLANCALLGLDGVIKHKPMILRMRP